MKVLAEQMPVLANPSSLHSAGRRARLAVDRARAEVAAAAGADPSEVIFTSGGTEADNLAVKGLYWHRRGQDSRRTVIVLPAIEHHAVLETAEWLEHRDGAELIILPVDERGLVDAESLEQVLSQRAEEIALVTVMWANNEVGSVQPIQELAQLCRSAGVPFHTDAVQAFGALEVNFAASAASTMAISGHKVGAPVGIGALLVRRNIALTPVLHGGGQERDIRSGTLDAPAICAFGAVAAEVAAQRGPEARRIAELRDRLARVVVESIPSASIQGPDPLHAPELRLPNNLHITVDGAEGDSLLFMLDMAGFDTATGSACTAGVPRPSHVLLAMGLSESQARGAQRFSLGHTTTAEDIDALAEALPDIAERACRAGLASQPSTTG